MAFPVVSLAEDLGSGDAHSSEAVVVEPYPGMTDEEYELYVSSLDASTPPNPRRNVDNGGSDISLFGLRASSPWWTGSGASKSFYTGYGNLYASPALKIVDVSEWQGPTINWQAVMADDVDGAILRIGYGSAAEDKCFGRNLSECRRLGIPYGVYLYSYSYTVQDAIDEANFTADVLDKYGCSDLTLPIYYDLEEWTWTGHTPPTSVATYNSIVRAYVGQMEARGYANIHVYSYTSYLNGPLNSSYIWSLTSWIAQYGPVLAIDNPYYDGQHGWQYTSSAAVAGIAGGVDVSAFTVRDGYDAESLEAIAVPEGVYYVNSVIQNTSGITLSSDDASNGVTIELDAAAHSALQRFVFTPQRDGSYVITNEQTGKALDVQSAIAQSGATVQQYEPNGSDAQKWYLKDSGSGWYLQSALGNWVLGISGGATSDGTSIALYAPDDSDAQKFVLSSPAIIKTGASTRISSALVDKFVLDIQSGSYSNGAAVQLYSWNASDAQLYKFEEVGNGIYTIENVNSGKLVEVPSGQTANGSGIAQYSANGTVSQRWAVIDFGTTQAFVGMRSGKALDVPGGTTSDGQRIQLYTPNWSAAQRWALSLQESTRDRLDALAGENRDTIDENRIYAIGSGLSERMVIDVASGSLSNGANVQLYSSNGTNAQRWSVEKDDVGYLTITNVASGKALEVADGSASSGANVWQNEPDGSYAQKWIAIENADGSIVLCSALAPGYVLDVNGADAANGTNVGLYSSNGSAAQRFWLYSVPPVPAANAGGATVGDGTYVLSASGSSVVVDVPGASTVSGLGLQAYEDNGSVAQSFYLEYDPSAGFYTVLSLASQQYLTTSAGDCVPGTRVVQSDAQLTGGYQYYWSLEVGEDGQYLIVNAANGQALGLSNLAGGGELITVPHTDDRAVRWAMKPSSFNWASDEVASAGREQGVVLRDGTYVISSSMNRGYVLDVDSASTANGANVQLYPNNGTDAQRWVVVNDDDGLLTIRNLNSGKALDVTSAIAEPLANVWQYDYNSSNAQKWLPVVKDDGTVVLYSALGKNLVLDVDGDRAEKGLNVQIGRYNDTAAQGFVFIPEE